MREIPGMVVINPSDDVEARAAVHAAYDYVGPVYLRFGRLAAVSYTHLGTEAHPAGDCNYQALPSADGKRSVGTQ